jgi:hypothetical protein
MISTMIFGTFPLRLAGLKPVSGWISPAAMLGLVQFSGCLAAQLKASSDFQHQ